MKNVRADNAKRTKTGMAELDRVLGGGLVRGGTVLLGGDPGIGKSTLLLQVCDELSKNTPCFTPRGGKRGPDPPARPKGWAFWARICTSWRKTNWRAFWTGQGA